MQHPYQGVKKAVSGVIVLSLFIVISVFSIQIYNNFIVDYTQQTYTSIESRDSGSNLDTQIIKFSDSVLYFNNGYSRDIDVHEISVNGENCNIEQKAGKGINEFNLKSCKNSFKSSTNRIIVITENGAFAKFIYLDSGEFAFENAPPSSPTDITGFPVSLYIGDELLVIATGSSDPDNDSISYLYLFENLNDSSVIQDWSADNSYIVSSGDYLDNIRVSAKASDSRSFSGVYSEQVSVSSKPPTAPTDITGFPLELGVGDILNLNAIGSTDYENDTLTYYYRFDNVEDSTLLKNWSTDNTYQIQSSDMNNSILVSAKAFDGISFSDVYSKTDYVENSELTAPTDITLTPEPFYVNDNIYAGASGSFSPEGNSITYYYKFENVDDGTLLQNWSTDNSYLVRENSSHDTIMISAKAYDGTSLSGPYSETYITQNTPPYRPTSIEGFPPYYGVKVGETFAGNATYSSTTTDIDGDNLTFYYRFYNVNDSTIRQAWSTQNNYTVVVDDAHDIIRMDARAYDGENYSEVKSETDTVANTKPDMYTGGRSPSSGYDFASGTTSATVSWNPGTDVDGDTLEYQVSLDTSTSATSCYYTYTSNWKSIDTGTSTSATITGLSDGMNVCWRVVGSDGYAVGVNNYHIFSVQSASGSCPMLYTFDGEKYNFETDLFNKGFLGLRGKKTSTRPPQSDEYYALNEGTLEEINGTYQVVIAEEKDEIDYYDEMKLYYADVPKDIDVYVDTKKKGDLILHTANISNLKTPQSCTGYDEEDCMKDISVLDKNYTNNGTMYRFDTMELDLGNFSNESSIKMIVNLFKVVPTSFPWKVEEINKLKKTSNRTDYEFMIEVINGSGEWESVFKNSKFPTEFPRTYAYELKDKFKTDDYRVRLSFWLDTRLDFVGISTDEDYDVELKELETLSAVLNERKTESRKDYMNEPYDFDYNHQSIYDAPSTYSGNFTRYGDVMPLLEKTDDKFVIFKKPDQINITYKAPEEVSSDKKREFIIYSNGYYKTTRNEALNNTVEPMPFRDMSNYPYNKSVENYPQDFEHQLYQSLWNTRECIKGYNYCYNTADRKFVSVSKDYAPLKDSYTSDITDVGTLRDAVLISYNFTNTNHSRTYVSIGYGNTSTPDDSWVWIDDIKTDTPYNISGKYLQYRYDYSALDKEYVPLLESFNIYY